MTHLMEQLFGVEDTEIGPADRSQTVGTSPSKLLDKNPNRVQITFANRSSSRIDVAPDPELASGEGIPLQAGGGTLTVLISEDGVLPMLEWHAVAGAASSSIEIIDVVVDQ